MNEDINILRGRIGAIDEEIRFLNDRKLELELKVQAVWEIELVEYAKGKSWAAIGRHYFWHPATAKQRVLTARRAVDARRYAAKRAATTKGKGTR